MNSKEDDIQAERERSEPTVALNPFTGVQVEDIVASARQLILKGVSKPLILNKHTFSYAQKLVEIIRGRANYEEEKVDRRFTDDAWQENTFYKFLLESYFAMNETLEDCVNDLNLDDLNKARATFILRLIKDSTAPTNTLIGNPAALRKSFETRGKSVLRGIQNLIGDIQHNHGIPSQVKSGVFKVGENLATTPGAVVFKNEVLELIQYTPTTKKVHERPLIMVGAMINKFYALDLTPDRSMIKFCVDQGLQVFVVSWSNPRKEQANWGVEKYAIAVLEAIVVIKSITNSKDLNLYSLCSGAMTASVIAAYLETQNDDAIHSMTMAVCMLDMQDTDMEVSAFVTEDMREKSKARTRKAGILPGYELARSMLILRPNELIWSNVVNNYLMGEEPPEFDLLYWNNDWTNLPAQLHSDFIDMYALSSLVKPNEMSIAGTPINLSDVECDKFIIGGVSDHITPWKACYRSALVHGGAKEFVLSNSGHIQTLLNSPSKKNASFFVNQALPNTAEAWRENAVLNKGSWWSYWSEWIRPRSGKLKAAPKNLGNDKYKPGVQAPGDYVHQKVS